MSALTRTMVLMLLALWGPATWHCDLEHVPGLEFLACADAAPHQDSDCEQDGCAVVESGLYKLEEHGASAPMPLLVVSLLLPLWEQTAPNELPFIPILTSAPPDLPRTWQFAFRAALPPRAPSLVA